MQIFWLNDVPLEFIDQLGGKARGLYYLEKHGFKTPKGFVVFDINNDQDIDSLKNFWQASELKNVAVRSSATREDGAEFSSAGQYQSYLNVSDEQSFIAAIKGCLASLDSENVEEYRLFAGQEKSKMAIVIQEMIDASFAGVAFSIDPLTRHDQVVIEAVEGLGEQLVSGLKQAFSYRISRVDPEFSNEFLADQHLKEIFEGTLNAENKWELPLDLEWAIDRNGVLVWLQARPITTREEVTIDELDSTHHTSNDTLTNHNVGEMLPGAITPLTISTIVYSIDHGLRKMLTFVGVTKKVEDIPANFCVSNYQGHLFFNMRYLYHIPHALILTDRESIDIGICGQPIAEQHDGPFPKINLFKRTYNFFRYGSFVLSNKKARVKIDHDARNLSFDLHASYSDLYEEIDDKINVLNRVMLNHYVTSSHSGAMSSAIFTILKKDHHDHDEIKALIAGVLEEIDDIESADILKSLRLIATASKKACPEIIYYSKEKLLEFFEQSDDEVKELYENFLRKHGHRAVKEAELRSPAWKDDRLSLMENIQVVLQQIGPIKTKEASNLQANINQLLNGYKGMKRRGLNYLIKAARAGCRNREYSKSRLVLASDRFKIAYRELASKLVAANLLPDQDLIYFLTHEELGELIFAKKNSLVKKAISRRRLFKEQELLKFNHVYQGKPQPLEMDVSNLVVGETLKGTTLSRGKVLGKARVVLTLADAKLLQPSEIMVAGYTDIGWSPYYAIIGGLITEVGSALSHGAVVAREYSLPLVSNVTLVTRKIKTGDLVALDADKGTITIIEGQPS